MSQQKSNIYPKKGDVFYFQAEVVYVKFAKDHIVVRLEEKYTKTRFNLKYPQTKLPGMEK